ncbi:MAG: exodeoxyribonuclease VII large subunit [Candidatus Sumerlaeia bacterium]|nr:exodeoxyribonuclease VII large subunit [Candidatus Sumerlaeia bacterium]
MIERVRLTVSIVTILLVIVSAIAQVQWIESYEQALSQAKSQPKPLLVYFYSKQSKNCKELESNILNKPEVYNFLNANFYNVHLDVEVNTALAAKLAVIRVPLIVVLDTSETELLRFVSFTTPEQFIKLLSAIVQPSTASAGTSVSATPVVPQTSAPTSEQSPPYLKINQITADKINTTVTIKGQITNMVSPTSPKAPYSYYVSDGTESIRVVIWEDVFQKLKNREQLKPGVEVLVRGKVKEFRNLLEIHLENPNGLQLASEVATAPVSIAPTPSTAPVSGATSLSASGITPISQLNSNLLNKTLTVRGKITNIIPSWQPKAPTTVQLEDESGGSIKVVYWPDVEKGLSESQRPVVDGTMLATGILSEYKGTLQLKVSSPSNIKVEKPAGIVSIPAGGIVPISSVTRQMIGQNITISGKITRKVSVRGGTIITVTDDTGSITVPLWDRITEQYADKDKIKEGAKITVAGVVSLYERRQEIQVQPNSATDIKSIEP